MPLKIEGKQEGKAEELKKISIAVIDLIAPITIRDKAFELIDGCLDSKIKGVMLIIDSGGGTMGDFSVLHDLVKKTVLIKPVIVFVAGSGCSGGYLVASAASYIVTASCSSIGSVGVFMEVMRHTGENSGKTGEITGSCEITTFKGGSHKDLYNPLLGSLSPEDFAYIQKRTQEHYDLFCKVAANRNLKIEERDLWADGRVFLPYQAIELGLIDEIGTFFEAKRKMSELLHTSEEELSFIMPCTDKK